MFDHKAGLTILARSIDPRLPNVMMEAVELLAVVCLVNQKDINGHDRVLEAITASAEMSNREHRFAAIIEGLKNENNVGLRVACMQLVNALISNNEDFDFRMHLRNEFLRSGFYDVWEEMCRQFDETDTQSTNDNRQANHRELNDGKTTSQSDSNAKAKDKKAVLADMLNVFNISKDEDYDELSQRYENIESFLNQSF